MCLLCSYGSTFKRISLLPPCSKFPKSERPSSAGTFQAQIELVEILCLSSLAVSLMTIHSKMKSLLSGQNYVNGRLNGKLLNVNSPICPKIELVKDFIAVLITGKSNEESIKNKIPIVQTTFSEIYGLSRVDKSHANSRKWVKIELV